MKEKKQIEGVHYLQESVCTLGPNGSFKQYPRVHLDKGARVQYVGRGLTRVDLVVCDDDMHAVEICQGDPLVIKEGETANSVGIIKVDAGCRPISEQFGIGIYYYEDGEMVDSELIEKSIAHAKVVEQKKKIEKETEAEKEREEIEQTLKEWEGILTPLKEGDEREKVAKSNLLTLLKREFPGVRFTGRKGYDSMTVSWTDGPTQSEVKKVCSRFEHIYNGDCYTDYYSTTNSTFTLCFGGWDSVRYNRDISNSFLQEMNREVQKFGSSEEFVDHCYSKFGLSACKGLERELEYSHPEDWGKILAKYTSRYNKMPQKQSKPESTPKAGEYSIIDYSEKSIALIGDTREMKEHLKKLGGRFNRGLRCGPGWIFSKKKEAALRVIFGL